MSRTSQSRPPPNLADLTPPDWEKARIPYCQGILSIRDVARSIGVAPSTLQSHAIAHNWTRDLSARAHARAQRALLLASDSGARPHATDAAPGALTPQEERRAVDAAAEALVRVRLGHRRDIARARGLVSALMDELETVQHAPEVFQKVRDWLESLDPLSTVPLPLLHEALGLVASLPQRVKVARDLVEALRSVVGMEREAFGMDTADGSRPVVVIKDYTGKGSAEAPPEAVEPVELEPGADGVLQPAGEPSEAGPAPAQAGKRPSTSAERMRALRQRRRQAAQGDGNA